MRRFVARSWPWIPLLVIGIVCGARTLRAEDGEGAALTVADRVDAWADAARDQERDHADDQLERTLAGAQGLLDAARADPSLGERERDEVVEQIVSTVGRLAAHSEESVARAAVAALGGLGVEDGLRYVKRYLRPTGKRAPAPIVQDAIDAAGAMGNDAAVPLLLRMVDKSDHTPTAARAMRALGGFGDSQRYRKRIVVDLVSTVRRYQPGGPKRGQDNQATGGYIPGKSGSSGGDRWAAFSSELPKTLNELTGQRLATAYDWIDMVQDHKSDLDSLFAEDE